MIVHIVAGAIAACCLLFICKISEFCGSESCRVSRERRLPYDSDALLFGGLLALGASIGGVVALICVRQGVPAVSSYWPLSAVAAGVAGFIVPLPLVRYLAAGYLERAQRGLDQGAYRDAIEDASEAERMYFDQVRKQAASQIKEQAQAARRNEIGIAG